MVPEKEQMPNNPNNLYRLKKISLTNITASIYSLHEPLDRHGTRHPVSVSAIFQAPIQNTGERGHAKAINTPSYQTPCI